jgi:hypothetical protein
MSAVFSSVPFLIANSWYDVALNNSNRLPWMGGGGGGSLAEIAKESQLPILKYSSVE